jgi:hypothetical protein
MTLPIRTCCHEDPMTASTRLQHHLNLLEAWATKWKIKINDLKSTRDVYIKEEPMSTSFLQ